MEQDVDRRAGAPARGARRPNGALIGAAAVIAVVAVVLWRPDVGPSNGPRSAAAPAPESADATWTPIADPDHMFALPASAIGVPLSAYGARKAGSGLRADTALFGMFGGKGPFLEVTFTRGGDRAAEPTAFFLALARSAAEAGLAVLKVGPRHRLDTKFGTAEVAETVLSGGTNRACLSFRVRHAGRDYGLSGWLCEPGAGLDRLTRIAAIIDALQWGDAGGSPV